MMDLRSSGTDVVIELVIQVPVILRTTVMSRQLKNVSIKMKHSTIILKSILKMLTCIITRYIILYTCIKS